jgi:hypothetical protein
MAWWWIRLAGVKFARWAFTGAGVYGLVVLAPQLFLEKATADASGPLTHPEYFYGFVCAAMVFQLLFLLIGRDPVRFRQAMIIGVLEKLSFGLPVWLLWAQHRVQAPVVIFASIDLMLGVLFAVAYAKTPKT